jgi:hypothetical protein
MRTASFPTAIFFASSAAFAAPPAAPATASQVTATTVTPGPVIAPPPPAAPAAPAAASPVTASPAPQTRAAMRAASGPGSVEDPTRTYYELGVRYRGIVLPSFVTGLFAQQAESLYFNNFGLELDIRRDGFSITPSLTYLGMGTDPINFADKSKPADYARNWSQITSQLKGIMIGGDFMWSTPIDRTVFLEYGIGVGLAVMFGDVKVNWLYGDPNVALFPCSSELDGPQGRSDRTGGCRSEMHDSNNNPPRVGNYTEPSWVDGGSKPNVIPWLSMPQLAIRANPLPEMQARVGGGLSIIGPWFGVSLSYGFPQENRVSAPRR